MDTNELMELAREAGLEVHIAGAASCIHSLGVRAVTFDDMHKFAALVVASERDRIATWAATQRNDIPATGEEFAAAIRARKD